MAEQVGEVSRENEKRFAGLAYSVGGLASTLAVQTVTAYVLFFYVDVMRLPAASAAAGMFAFGIWNAVNDPLIGYVSDRTRTRFGRRIPYMAFGLVPLSLVFALVWAPPFAPFDTAASGGAAAFSPLFIYFLLAVFLFDGLYTLVFLNWTALFPEMFQSLSARARVGAWRQIFGLVGMVFGVALAPLLYGSVGWAAMGWIFAALIALFGGISLWGSREKGRPSEVATPSLFPALRLTLSNRSFLAYVAANFFVQFAFVLLLGAIPFYAKYVLGMAETENTLLLGAIFLTTIALLYPWSRWLTRWGGRRAMIVSLVGLSLSMSPFAWVSGLWGGVATGALLGVALAGVLLTVDVVIADVIDEDEVRTGARREGTYFGVNAFVIRLGVSLQAVVMGWVLSGTGYDPGLAVQPESARAGLRLLMTGVPMIALLLAAAAMWLYPLHGGRLQQVKAELAEEEPGGPS